MLRLQRQAGSLRAFVRPGGGHERFACCAGTNSAHGSPTITDQDLVAVIDDEAALSDDPPTASSYEESVGPPGEENHFNPLVDFASSDDTASALAVAG